MCLAIPSQVVKIENNIGTVEIDGVKRDASLLLLEDVEVGDYVIIHAGFAIHKIDVETALESLAFLREAAEYVETQAPDI
ncbi:HypC/HybG/HupF family hydrogenase formation chaperone [Desulfococcaceae bacterium HSG7]|nr:HypC/HybG/HupF family hydrogenase formation chaperone [Desulfococcaceae bacterium HSG9]MDM8556758.1 HypC/HybG/HupF family hydrogenase formation chaperone [Desulfococcaceae bacterium HSG7]